MFKVYDISRVPRKCMASYPEFEEQLIIIAKTDGYLVEYVGGDKPISLRQYCIKNKRRY